jgi:hypothetical protein
MEIQEQPPIPGASVTMHRHRRRRWHRRPPANLFLLKWSFYGVIALVIILVIFVVWGLATRELSQNRWDVEQSGF